MWNYEERWNKKNVGKMQRVLKWRNEVIAHAHMHIASKDENVIHEIEK